ncbi:MAG: hypothetical protein FWD42_04515 [Solirubrobacterales bacterium]|nr:hypothetical protein [Solirubrobacterales bacterium]
MEFALILRELARRRLLLALGVAVAAIAALFSVYRVEGSKLVARSLQYSSASTEVLVDTPSSMLGNVSQSFEQVSARATIYANFMVSPGVLKVIGEQAGIPGEQIYAAGPIPPNEPRIVLEPTALKRNVQITGETDPYRLDFESQPNLPTIIINSQAPTTTQAVALANAAAAGLRSYVDGVERAEGIPPHRRVRIRQLGSAHGAVVNGGVSKGLATIVFIVVFVVWCLLILAVTRFRRNWRASGVLAQEWQVPETAGPEVPEVRRGDAETERAQARRGDATAEVRLGDATAERPQARRGDAAATAGRR